MHIATRKMGHVVILDLAGNLTTGKPSTSLNQTFNELLEREETRFVFNMLKVPWLDSGGIGTVVACRARAMRRQGVIRLALEGRAHDLFTIMSLDKVFELYETVDESLASLVDWQPDTRPLPSEPDPREALLELACQTPES